jgi:cytochrome c oxidase cbb3-type subunit 1
MHPFYVIRALGGVLYLLGGFIMAYNIWMTARGRVRDEQPYMSAAPLLLQPAE